MAEYDIQTLVNVCNHKSASQGGLNIPAILKVLLHYGVVPKKSRMELDQQICELVVLLEMRGPSSTIHDIVMPLCKSIMGKDAYQVEEFIKIIKPFFTTPEDLSDIARHMYGKLANMKNKTSYGQSIFVYNTWFVNYFPRTVRLTSDFNVRYNSMHRGIPRSISDSTDKLMRDIVHYIVDLCGPQIWCI